MGAPFEDNGAGVVILYFGRKDIEYIDKKEIIKGGKISGGIFNLTPSSKI